MWHNHPFSQRNKEQKTGGGGWRRRCQTKFEKVGYEI